jgi:hypothetical protein
MATVTIGPQARRTVTAGGRHSRRVTARPGSQAGQLELQGCDGTIWAPGL